MRKKFALAVLAVAVAMGSVVPRLRAQTEFQPYNCFGGYDGSCAVTWIKNCYC
jgi:hypothetical protein